MKTTNGETQNERLKMIEEMLLTHPDDPFLHYVSALEHRKAGNLSRSVEILESLRKNQSDYLGTYYQLGKLYEETGMKEEALAVYRAGLEVAKQQSDQKTLGELSEALLLLEDDV